MIGHHWRLVKQPLTVRSRGPQHFIKPDGEILKKKPNIKKLDVHRRFSMNRMCYFTAHISTNDRLKAVFSASDEYGIMFFLFKILIF